MEHYVGLDVSLKQTSEGRYSLRQARGQLPRVRPACINKAVAAR
jgi:hypothetical protein